MGTQETVQPKKRRGPAPTGQGTPVQVRLQPEQLAPLDAWIADQPEPKPSRPEAIREAVSDWLELQESKREGSEATPSARGFFTAADGYRTAASALYPLINGSNTQIPSVFLSFYNVLGLSFELYFKSYLSISSFRPEQMQRKFGHRLLKLRNKAHDVGLEADFMRFGASQEGKTSDFLQQAIFLIAPQYLDNSLRYISSARFKYTHIDNMEDIFVILQRLHYVVQNKLAESGL